MIALPVGWLYIDGTDAASEGTFVSHYTGANLTYTKWYGGEPNDYRDNEDCINMYVYKDGTWNDIACSTSLPAVCKIVIRKFP